MRLLTLSERKGSASFGAGPLFVDGGYCGDVCSIWYQVVQSRCDAAPLGTQWCNLAAMLLRLVRSGVLFTVSLEYDLQYHLYIYSIILSLPNVLFCLSRCDE